MSVEEGWEVLGGAQDNVERCALRVPVECMDVDVFEVGWAKALHLGEVNGMGAHVGLEPAFPVNHYAMEPAGISFQRELEIVYPGDQG